MSGPNTNPETGIRYGVINANDVHWLFEEIIDKGTNTTYENYLEEVDSQIQSFFADKENNPDDIKGYFNDFNINEEQCQQFAEEIAEIERDLSKADLLSLREILLENTVVEFNEAQYKYEKDEESYEVTHLSGPLIWVIKSPIVTRVNLCSPCAPNAGDLNSPNPEGFICYAVPVDWFDESRPCPYIVQSVPPSNAIAI